MLTIKVEFQEVMVNIQFDNLKSINKNRGAARLY